MSDRPSAAMQIEILTIFPEYFRSPLAESLLGKAIAAGRVDVRVTNLRDFSQDRHRKVDDEPYGGGAGMVLMAPVVAAAVEARRGSPPAWSILLTPDGARLDQRKVEELAARERLLLFCGRYEGVDERAREVGLFDEEISLGDFVLPGGEAAALALTEAVSRLVPGVVGRAESVERESAEIAGPGVVRIVEAVSRFPRPRGAGRAALRRSRADRAVPAGARSRAHA